MAPEKVISHHEGWRAGDVEPFGHGSVSSMTAQN
jgi:hypothetical protein